MSPERVLDGANEAALDAVLVIGKHESGSLYMAGSHSDLAELLLLVKRVEMQLLAMAEDDE